MAQFIRGKQAGIQGDLSSGIHSDVFILDDVSAMELRSQHVILRSTGLLLTAFIVCSLWCQFPDIRTRI